VVGFLEQVVGSSSSRNGSVGFGFCEASSVRVGGDREKVVGDGS